MKILYFSNAFIANHGGRLHSEAFLKEADLNARVSEINPYPVPKRISRNQGINTPNGLRTRLKNNPLFQILFFYRRNYKSFKEIAKILEEINVDVLHIRVDSNFLIIPKLKRRFPNLLITTEVNASPFDENFGNIASKKFFQKKERECLRKSDANFFVSGYLRESIMLNIDNSRDFVVHNGVALESFPSKSQNFSNGDSITLGYVGTLDYHKNLKMLIDAFNEVYAKSKFNLTLKIFGDGPMFDELKEYIELLELNHLVHLMGWIDHSEVAQNIESLDIAIHHSANPYMSPLKIFEYMAVGVSVIGPDIPAVREIFEDGKDILLVKNSKNDLMDKILFLVDNPSIRKNIAKTGSLKVRNHYGWDSNADNIIKVMKEKFDENN